MKQHLHKRLQEAQVVDILQKYFSKTIRAKEAYRYLAVSRSRFYELLILYQKNPGQFTITYKRNKPNNKLQKTVQEHILAELSFEKEKIIDNPNVPTNRYNYSYIRNLLREKYNEQVSLPTIITLAKANDFFKTKRKREQIHTRQVLTNFVGELVQHDSSHHLFAPDCLKKWYLITSLDDYSRKLLHARLVLMETTWRHIQSVEDVCIRFGIPFSYYVDQHSIFRYVKDRDKFSIYTTYTKFTGDVDTQWNALLKDLSVKPIFALSPEAKGKIERPYQWLQDHLVRTCVRYGITDISKGQLILNEEVKRYNNKQVHTVTGEIPNIRFNKAIKEGKTLFRPFIPTQPYTSKDIFSLRETRSTNGYRSISLYGTKLKVPHVDPYRPIDIRMLPDVKKRTVEVRFWHEKTFLGCQTLPAKDLPGVHF
jgi:hypothetical protein